MADDRARPTESNGAPLVDTTNNVPKEFDAGARMYDAYDRAVEAGVQFKDLETKPAEAPRKAGVE